MRISVAGEYVAGHVTFLDALHQFALERTDLTINMLRLPFAPERGWERLPPISSNWSVRASLRTRRRLGRAWRDQDALLIHTQTAALFSVGLMRESDGLHWPRRGGLRWLHLASVVVGVDVP